MFSGMKPCPICNAPVAADSRSKPFCSEHCRLVDLGRWFGGDYRVAGPAVEPGSEAVPVADRSDDDGD